MATVLAELAGRLEHDKLTALARNVSMATTQRLGWLLVRVGPPSVAQPLVSYVCENKPPIVPLRAGRTMRGSPRDFKWRLGINADVEPDV